GRRLRISEIARFVRESELFIQKRVLELENLHRRFPEKKYVSGETFLLAGEPRVLETIWTWSDRTKLRSLGDRLEMCTPLHSTRDERRAALHSWFKKSARAALEDRVLARASEMNLFPRKV